MKVLQHLFIGVFAFLSVFLNLSAASGPTVDDIRLFSDIQCVFSKSAASGISAALLPCLNPRDFDASTFKDPEKVRQLLKREGADALLLFIYSKRVPKMIFDYGIHIKRPQQKAGEVGNEDCYLITVYKVENGKKEDLATFSFYRDGKSGVAFAPDESGTGHYYIEFTEKKMSAEDLKKRATTKFERDFPYDFWVQYRIEHRYGDIGCLEVVSDQIIGVHKDTGASVSRSYPKATVWCHVFGRDGKEIDHFIVSLKDWDSIEKYSEIFARWFHDLNHVRKLNIRTISVGSLYRAWDNADITPDADPQDADSGKAASTEPKK